MATCEPRDTTALDRAVLHNPTVIVMIGLLLRCCVGLHPHSGQGLPPKYGEFEGQRHMLEITVSIPIDKWYINGTDNDLDYWGISYPPLASYLALLWGQLAAYVMPDLVQLELSRGFETEDAREFMRASVLILDVLLFIPAVWCFCIIYYSSSNITYEDDEIKDSVGQFLLYSSRGGPVLHSPKAENLKRRRGSENSFSSGTLTLPVALVSEVFLLILLQPSFVIIDHGHFHYGVVYLGLLLWMLVFIMRGQYGFGTIFYCLALNVNQITFLVTPAVLPYMVATASSNTPLASRLYRTFKIFALFLFTFGILWSPFCFSGNELSYVSCYDGIKAVWYQIAPIKFSRQGASMFDILPRFRYFDETSKIYISVVFTFLGSVPSCIDILRKRRSPATRRLIWAIFNVSLTFYICFFNMHPRAILLPLLPASLLAGEVPGPSCWFSLGAIFSLSPLLLNDKLGIAYFVSTSVFTATCALCFRREICFLPLPWMETRSFWSSKESSESRYGIRMIDFTKMLQGISVLCICLNLGLILCKKENQEFWEWIHGVVSILFFILSWCYGNWYQVWIPDFDIGDKSKTE